MDAPVRTKVDGRDATVSHFAPGIIKVLFDDGECIFGVSKDEGRSQDMIPGREARLALNRIIESDLKNQKGWVEFHFNPNHLPAGPGGGQFTSGEGGGGAKDFVASGKTTEQIHKDPKTGKYSAERAALHQAVVDKALAGHVPVPGRAPVATILGGGTASGKTTASRQIIGNDPNVLRIDPDEIKLSIPEYSTLKAEDLANAAARVHEESSDLTKAVVANAIANKLDFIYDSTTSGNGGVAMAKRLVAEGYDTHALFVDVPINIARERAALRAETSLDPMNKGRIVPDHIIQSSHQGAAEKFLEISKLPGLTSARLYDNSGTSASLVFSKEGGKEGIVHDTGKWERYKQKAAGKLD